MTFRHWIFLQFSARSKKCVLIEQLLSPMKREETQQRIESRALISVGGFLINNYCRKFRSFDPISTSTFPTKDLYMYILNHLNNQIGFLLLKTWVYLFN